MDRLNAQANLAVEDEKEIIYAKCTLGEMT
jgi:hypothetical protein